MVTVASSHSALMLNPRMHLYKQNDRLVQYYFYPTLKSAEVTNRCMISASILQGGPYIARGIIKAYLFLMLCENGARNLLD